MGYSLRLRTIRKSKNLTQSELGQLINTSERTVGGWERGETCITLEDAWNVSVALGCSPNDLCGWPAGDCGGVRLDVYEEELIECYRSSTDERKRTMLTVGRDSAAMSKSGPECSVFDAEEIA